MALRLKLGTTLRTTLTPPSSRSLHMTGPASFTTLLTSDKPSAASLAAELAHQARLADAVEASAYHQNPPSRLRHFNTSRSLKSVGDNSTIDFAYLPDSDAVDGEGDGGMAGFIRVPLLPAGLYESLTSYAKEAPEQEVMRPEIITASADGTHVSSPRAFGEVHDNSAIDVSGVAQDIASALDNGSGAGSGAAGEPGMVKTIWKGMMEDLFGGNTGSNRKTG